jgi:hypothetical protein
MSAPPAFYFQLESCCTGEVINFQPPVALNDPIYGWTFPQVLVYDAGQTFGDQAGLISKTCYLVTTIVGNGSSYPTLGGGWMTINTGATSCPTTPAGYGECEQCPPCYLVMTCDGSLAPFTTDQDLSAYVGQSVVLVGSDFPEKCVQVIVAPPNAQCDFFTSPLTYVEDCFCDCNCYQVIANSKNCYYLDCDGNFQTTGPLTGTMIDIPCASTTPWIVGNVPNSKIEITNIGLCVNGQCPDPCYRLIDCDGIQDPIDTNKVSLGQYAILGQIVKIEGYPDTCWIVDSEGDCECAIDVTVFQAYEDCPTCKDPSKYKLTNCADSGTIVYTSSDLSAFVGQVILRGECPGCWLVTTIDDIPSDTIVTVTAAYLNCTECAREYYLLTDCTGYKDPVITYTDLSQYLGSVIKIKYCPETCWTVTATNDPTDAGIVIPEVEYEDCPECLLTFPCVCTTVRNDSTTLKEYRYYDCNLDIQFFNLAPGAKSDRFCMRVWAIYFPETDYIETYGNCSETTSDIWECPAIIYPRRSVKPGYNTPACTIAKYEKISCKSAEVYYKQVLYLRYGITDCCPDENDKWLIKKELIDLDALRDPNYECTAVSSCCPSTPSCGSTPCGCTSSIPCNSH